MWVQTAFCECYIFWQQQMFLGWKLTLGCVLWLYPRNSHIRMLLNVSGASINVKGINTCMPFLIIFQIHPHLQWVLVCLVGRITSWYRHRKLFVSMDDCSTHDHISIGCRLSYCQQQGLLQKGLLPPFRSWSMYLIEKEQCYFTRWLIFVNFSSFQSNKRISVGALLFWVHFYGTKSLVICRTT